MADNDFPRLVYKKSDAGNAQPVWDLGTFEFLEATDQAAVDAALADGWTLSPGDEPTPPVKAKSAAPASASLQS